MITSLALSFQHVLILLIILGFPALVLFLIFKPKARNSVSLTSIETKNKTQKLVSPINRLKFLSQSDRYIYGAIMAIFLALICGYLFSDTEYYLSSNEFSNGVRISTAEYEEMAKNNNSDYAMTRLRFNYLIFFSSLIIFLGIGYSLDKRINK